MPITRFTLGFRSGKRHKERGVKTQKLKEISLYKSLYL